MLSLGFPFSPIHGKFSFLPKFLGVRLGPDLAKSLLALERSEGKGVPQKKVLIPETQWEAHNGEPCQGKDQGGKLELERSEEEAGGFEPTEC